MLIIDGHLDLATSALNLRRDLKQPVEVIRRLEREMTDHRSRGYNTVSLPELRRGRVAVALATADWRPRRHAPDRRQAREAGYSSREEAYALTRGQLAYYRLLATQGWVRVLGGWTDLQDHVRAWQAWEAGADGGNGARGGPAPLGAAPGDGPAQEDAPPLGVIPAMEGAEPITRPDQVWHWYELGIRVVGLTHSRRGVYAHGGGSERGLTPDGRRLLAELERCGMMLDVTHLSEPAFWEALEAFDGVLSATHQNCRALVPGARQFSDEQIRAVIERDGVLGAAMDGTMLYSGWVRGETANEVIGLEDVVNHMDHVCQLAGNARHAAIGTDLDGLYGQYQAPRDLETVADLQKIPALLTGRGYDDADVAAICHGNWLRVCRHAWAGEA